MLRSFRVANHKSFRDEAELLMLPAYDKARPTTPVAAIFGANASGKSNLLDALRWMRAAVRESYARWEPGSGVPRTPFRLDPEAAAQPSLYCVEIIIEGSRYTYGLEVDDERVREEWLYTYPHNRRRIIFERGTAGVRLGSTVPDHRALSEQLARQTRDNALFLSVAAHNDLAEVLPAYEWFRSAMRFDDGNRLDEGELSRRFAAPQERAALVELIRAADLGITDVVRVRDTAEHETLRKWLDEQIREARQQHSDMSGPDLDQVGEYLLEIIDQFRRWEQSPFWFRHGESDATLSLAEQSDGTRSWIGLISVALDAITTGGLMVVDEVDASLHPHLTSRLINLFRDTENNPGGAQLLLTTHDATLLDDETLSRDEIWFVEKEPESGAARLYALTNFHPRKNENTEGRYLAGGYGAIPLLAEYRFRKALRPGQARDAAA